MHDNGNADMPRDWLEGDRVCPLDVAAVGDLVEGVVRRVLSIEPGYEAPDRRTRHAKAYVVEWPARSDGPGGAGCGLYFGDQLCGWEAAADMALGRIRRMQFEAFGKMDEGQRFLNGVLRKVLED